MILVDALSLRLSFILGGLTPEDWVKNPIARHIIGMWIPCSPVDRCEILRSLGVRIGKNVIIDYGVWIDPVAPDRIEIQDYVTLAYGVTVLSHYAALNTMCGFPYQAKPTVIKQNAHVATQAMLLPGVTVGESSIVAAGSVVTRDVPPETVVAGNPARPISTLRDFVSRYRSELEREPWAFCSKDPGPYRPPLGNLPSWLQALCPEDVGPTDGGLRHV